jgi:hypothetical protein
MSNVRVERAKANPTVRLCVAEDCWPRGPREPFSFALWRRRQCRRVRCSRSSLACVELPGLDESTFRNEPRSCIAIARIQMNARFTRERTARLSYLLSTLLCLAMCLTIPDLRSALASLRIVVCGFSLRPCHPYLHTNPLLLDIRKNL